MKRTTTYEVIIYDITRSGDYDNPRGESYASWKEALQAYRYAKRHDAKDTLVELEKETWENGDIVVSTVIYSKEIR